MFLNKSISATKSDIDLAVDNVTVSDNCTVSNLNKSQISVSSPEKPLRELKADDMRTRHIFHLDCIHKWAQTDNRCPLCKACLFRQVAFALKERAKVLDETKRAK